MTAAGAQRALAAAIIENGKADVVDFGAGGSGCHLEALLMRKLLGDGFGVHRHSVVVENAAQLDHLIGGKIELKQAGQLRVTVLLDDINALVRGHKVVNCLGKGKGPDAQIIRVFRVALLDLVKALGERAIGGTES